MPYKKKPVILGTDWWTDSDDVVAARVLAWAQDKELIEIKGVGIDACMPFSAPSLDAFLTAEGLPDIPIGIDLSAVDYPGEGVYQQWLAQHPHRFDSNSDYGDSLSLYRRILSETPEPVDIMEIGFGQVLSRLLASPPDDISPLTGRELITQKVGKLWMMAGKWDEDGGVEYNFSCAERCRAAAHHICRDWPTPITFLGFEIGFTVVTGDTLTSENDLLRQTLCHAYSPNGRFSWDPMLVLLACTGDARKSGYRLVRGTARVDSYTGANYFTESDTGNHTYVIKDKPDRFYKDAINSILEEREQF